MKPKVFIIILNWNGWPDTLECLASLEKLNYENFEVILIDNASDEKIPISIRQLADQFPNLKIEQILNKENLGFAGGNNQGIKIALDPPGGGGADYILLLNNDTTVESDFLVRLIEIAENNKEYGILGPAIYYYDKPNKIWFAGGKINWLRTKGTHLAVIPGLTRNPEIPGCRIKSGMTNENEEPIKTDYITGCCLLAKREMIEKIGLLSGDYFLYYEDVDWCLRAKKADYDCGLVANAKIWHKQSQSAGEFSYPYIYYHSRNGLILGSRFGLKLIVYLISFWIILKQIIKLIIGFRRNWAKPVMKGVWDFWRGKKGKLRGYY